MKKKIFSISFFLPLFLFSSTTEYTFKASGDDAKELKQIVENYKKNKNLNVEISKKEDKTNIKDSRFLAIGINKNIHYSISEGRKIYMQNCAKCHGIDGEKKAYGVSAKLKNLSSDSIYSRFVAYGVDSQFGGKFRSLMQPISARTNSTQLGYIITYLKGDNAFTKTDEIKNSKMQTTPTEQGIYIK